MDSEDRNPSVPAKAEPSKPLAGAEGVAPARRTAIMANGPDVKLAEIGTRRWFIKAKAEHTLADVKHPSYFWARARRSGNNGIGPHETIEVMHENHAFYLELYVAEIDAATLSVRCHVLREYDFTKKALPKTDLSPARIENKGVHKWCVILGTDFLSKGHATKAEAEAWLEKKIAG